MPTIAYSVLDDDVVLFLAGNGAPSEADWRAYAGMLSGVASRARTSGTPIKFLVIADEGGPDAKQRATIVDVLHGVSTRTAVISESVIARNLITAFGWLNFAIKGFGPTNLAAALAYLGLPQQRITEVLSTAVSLAPRVGRIRCLEAAARAQSEQ